MPNFYYDDKEYVDEILLTNTKKLLNIISRDDKNAFIGFFNSIRGCPQDDIVAIFEAASLLTNQNYILNCAILSQQPEIPHLLIDNNIIDANLKDQECNTPLHRLISNTTSYSDKHAETLQLLLKKGADVNAQNYHHETPLHRAAIKGDEVMIELLFKNGACANLKNALFDTPLHCAVVSGKQVIAELLLKKSADVNAQNYRHETPLHYAIMQGNKDMIEFLLKSSANIKIENRQGLSPIDIAKNLGFEAIEKLLLAQISSPVTQYAAIDSDPASDYEAITVEQTEQYDMIS